MRVAGKPGRKRQIIDKRMKQGTAGYSVTDRQRGVWYLTTVVQGKGADVHEGSKIMHAELDGLF